MFRISLIPSQTTKLELVLLGIRTLSAGLEQHCSDTAEQPRQKHNVPPGDVNVLLRQEIEIQRSSPVPQIVDERAADQRDDERHEQNCAENERCTQSSDGSCDGSYDKCFHDYLLTLGS